MGGRRPSGNPTWGVGKAHVEKLIQRVDRVAGRGMKALKLRCQVKQSLRQLFGLWLVLRHERVRLDVNII